MLNVEPMFSRRVRVRFFLHFLIFHHSSFPCFNGYLFFPSSHVDEALAPFICVLLFFFSSDAFFFLSPSLLPSILTNSEIVEKVETKEKKNLMRTL